eukprot:344204-Prorocentrum_minimum.AAC.1
MVYSLSPRPIGPHVGHMPSSYWIGPPTGGVDAAPRRGGERAHRLRNVATSQSAPPLCPRRAQKL